MPSLTPAQIGLISAAVAELLDADSPDATPPEAIAGRLEKAGVRGLRFACLTCPVSEWICRKTGIRVWVTYGSVWHLEQEVCPVPWPIKNFIERHDAGDYPNLCPAPGG